MTLILPLVRHGLTALGGYLASAGVIRESDIEQVSGALIVIGSVLWMFIEKRLKARRG